MTKQIRRRAPTKEPTGNLRIIVNLLRRKRGVTVSELSAGSAGRCRAPGLRSPWPAKPASPWSARGPRALRESIDWRRERGCPMDVEPFEPKPALGK